MNKTLVTSLLGAIAMGALFAAPASAADVGACLITKNNTNPFFVKMKEGATKGATDAGIKLSAYAGVTDGDAAPQITAIENCVASGAKGILITASNDSVIPALKKARAAGLLVIALDTPIVRNRQLSGWYPHRPVGQGNARRQGQGRPHRHARHQQGQHLG